MTGIVKHYSISKQYGYIWCPMLQEEIFFRVRDVQIEYYPPNLEEGDVVTFNIIGSKTGYEARNVMRLEEAA